MEKLGYIITDRKLKGVWDLLEQVDDISLTEPSKPSLLIGWKKASEMEGYTSIIEKKIGENLYWTFSKSESRAEFEKDLDLFTKKCITQATEYIKYYYVNVMRLTYSKAKKLLEIIDAEPKRTIYISGGMMYIPYDGDVLGISLYILSYCGVKVSKAKKRVSTHNIVQDTDKEVMQLRKMLGNKRYALPLFVK